MPSVNALPAAGVADAYGRVAAVSGASQGNVSAQVDGAAQTAPAGAGPAAVVNISREARDVSANRPGLNNGTMAAEGGNAAELRNLLAARYNAQSTALDLNPE